MCLLVSRLPSCLPNVPPHTNKGKGVSVKVKGGGYLGTYWRGTSQRFSENLLTLERKKAPSMRQNQLSIGKAQLHKQCFHPGPKNTYSINVFTRQLTLTMNKMSSKVCDNICVTRDSTFRP
jgi:hypothetical protein